MYTIVDAFPGKNSLKIAMVGDLRYGRTVRSLSYLLTKYANIEIIFVSPPVCKMERDIKAYLDKYNVPWREEANLAKIAPEVDCVYMTRIQKERFHNPADYQAAAGKYILTLDRVQTMKPGAIIMHPLPRVDEIPKDVDDDPRARYFQQAQNGLYIRMALLYLLLKKKLVRAQKAHKAPTPHIVSQIISSPPNCALCFTTTSHDDIRKWMIALTGDRPG